MRLTFAGGIVDHEHNFRPRRSSEYYSLCYPTPSVCRVPPGVPLEGSLTTDSGCWNKCSEVAVPADSGTVSMLAGAAAASVLANRALVGVRRNSDGVCVYQI